MADREHDCLDALLYRQSRSWLAGNRLSVEELLAGSGVQHDNEVQLDLIYNEIVLREGFGEKPSVEDYACQYPHLRESLQLHFEVHSALDESLDNTARLAEPGTLPEVKPLVPETQPHLPDYELLQLLGRGGMGVVYLARHRQLRRPVALKMFEAGGAPSSREVLRFRAEAEAIARLQHRNIIQIYEIGEAGGLPFLVLELAEGGTLADRLQKLPFTPRAAAELIELLAHAVHHAHSQGIVHRDLKPANVLFMADGTPKLTDFGLAKILHDDPTILRDATRSGEPIGTPRYMAPEQATGQHDDVGPATDIYALGTLLYECLTGQVPFVAPSVVETLEKIRLQDPLSLRRLQPAIPRDLETICLNCLHKEPVRRYLSAQALADDLRRFLNGEPITARPTPVWERAWKWCRRRPTHAALIGVAVVLLGSGGAGAGIWHKMERDRITAARTRVEQLMQEGQEALLREDEPVAEARFREAWILVQGEPALRDYQTGVGGWLDHSRQALNKQRWEQRVPPREFDECRDEAMLLSLLLDANQGEAIKTAREAIADALDLTIPNDPAWVQERERLILLDAELIFIQDGAEPALARLSSGEVFSSRLVHIRRAAYLELLGRREEAEMERNRGVPFPPHETSMRLFVGMDRMRHKDFATAEREFEAILEREPRYFVARLFQAVCALNLNKPGAAKVGLTACLAQRPYFVWSYRFRGMCAEKLGDPAGAQRDSTRAEELFSRRQVR